MLVIFGIAALFGLPAVSINGRPIFGVAGLAISLVFAAVPPLVVLGWRKYSRKK
jgi:hypothetical protein